jgi:hypothetical protein
VSETQVNPQTEILLDVSANLLNLGVGGYPLLQVKIHSSLLRPALLHSVLRDEGILGIV